MFCWRCWHHSPSYIYTFMHPSILHNIYLVGLFIFFSHSFSHYRSNNSLWIDRMHGWIRWWWWETQRTIIIIGSRARERKKNEEIDWYSYDLIWPFLLLTRYHHHRHQQSLNDDDDDDEDDHEDHCSTSSSTTIMVGIIVYGSPHIYQYTIDSQIFIIISIIMIWPQSIID